MGEGDVQADESPLTRAANQLRIPLRERRKLSTAATEVAKCVADDDPARRSEHEEILRALESSAREVLATAVRAQRAEESGEEPSTPVAEDNGHVERLCAAVQAALDHRACATCAGWSSGIGEMLRLDRLKIGSSGAGVGASDAARPPEARTAAAALEAFERDLEPASSRFNVFRPQAARNDHPGPGGDRVEAARIKKQSPPATTPAAKVRGWIHRALNAGELANKVAALARRHDITRAGQRNRCYDPGALIADEESAGRLLGACVGLSAVKFDLPTDAETLEALFSSKIGSGDAEVRDDAEVLGSNPAGGAGILLNKTWGAVTAAGAGAVIGVGALGGHAATGVGALGGHAAAGVAAIGTGAQALGSGAVTGVATGVKTVGEGVKTVGEGVKTVGEGALSGLHAGVRTVAGMWAPAPGPVGAGGEEDDLLSDMRDVLAEEGVALLDERIDLGGGIG